MQVAQVSPAVHLLSPHRTEAVVSHPPAEARLTLFGVDGSVPAKARREMSDTRILLVEFRPVGLREEPRASAFPFVLGALRYAGAAAEWVVLPIEAGALHAGGRFVVDLSDEEAARLAAVLDQRSPGIVITSDAVAPALEARLPELPPGAWLLSQHSLLGGDPRSIALGPLLEALAEELPADSALDPSAVIADVVEPDYGYEVVGDEAAAEDVLVFLLGTIHCLYRRSVRSSPAYRDREELRELKHRGCAFCGAQLRHTTGLPLQVTPLELALRQLRGHQAARGRPAGHKYMIEDARIVTAPGAFFRAVLDEGFRPSTFHLSPRADELLRAAPELEQVLPDLAAAGHKVRLPSIGLESFSRAENERFAKGLEPEQIEQAVELLESLEERFSEVFECRSEGWFSAIGFTPRTTLEDLRANAAGARRLGPEWLRYFLGTRLQLVGGRAIAELARADGLLAERFSEPAYIEPVCLTEPGEVERPWRFADEKAARAHALLIRLEPVPSSVELPRGDELYRELNGARGCLPAWLDADHVALVEALVEALDRVGPGASPRQLLSDVASSAPRQAPAARTGMSYTEARRVLRVASALPKRFVDRAGGHRLTEGRLHWRVAAWRVHLGFAVAGRELKLRVEWRRGRDRAWVESEHLKLSYESETPPTDPVDTTFARLLLELLERHALRS